MKETGCVVFFPLYSELVCIWLALLVTQILINSWTLLWKHLDLVPYLWGRCGCVGLRMGSFKSYYSMSLMSFQFFVVQSLSHLRLFVTPWTAAHQASLSFIISQSLLKLMSIELVMPSNHLILCHSLLLLPSIFPSISVFSNESALPIKWPKCWSFSFSISSSNDYSGLISFRMDWFDLLAVQGTLKSLLQHHSSKASVLWHSSFFMVQLSHLYLATGKTTALRTFVGKVMSLLYFSSLDVFFSDLG